MKTEDKKGVQMKITVSNDVHEKLNEIQESLKNQGISMTLANIVSKHLDLTKDKIKTGYEK